MKVNGTVPVLVMVIVWGTLVEPTTWSPKCTNVALRTPMGAVLVVGFPGAAACTGGAVIEPGTTSAAKRRRDRTVRRRGLLVVRAGSSINTRHTRRVYPRRYPAR